MRDQIDALTNEILRLQSLDDLGSPEANETAWQRMLSLQRRRDELERRQDSPENERANWDGPPRAQ